MTRSAPRIDSPRMGPRLRLVPRGAPQGAERPLIGGDPLNLIRVMPAKGLDTMPKTYVRAGLIGPSCVVPAVGAGTFA
jgi:hypothetical protein